MMTEKVFWRDPYLTVLDTTVQSVEGSHVTLAETIFFAFSGGQESDAGWIGGFRVLQARKQDKEIIYTLAEEHTLSIRDKVTVTIDWERRYQLMRLHFAAEIVLELVYRKFPTIEKIGAHISQEKARIDFLWEQPFSRVLVELQQEAQNIIDSHHDILCDFSDKKNEKRFWKISGFSQVPCGGTHVKNTREIGKIKLKRANPGKGKERLEIFLLDPQII